MSDRDDVPEAVQELICELERVCESAAISCDRGNGRAAERDALDARAALLAAIAPAFRDAKRLRAFALACVRASRDLAGWPGDIEGGEFQSIAEKHGVLVKVVVDGPCSDSCSCADCGEFPQTCYQIAPALAAGYTPEARDA